MITKIVRNIYTLGILFLMFCLVFGWHGAKLTDNTYVNLSFAFTFAILPIYLYRKAATELLDFIGKYLPFGKNKKDS